MSATAMKKMAEALKQAEGRFEKYTPWYTAALGGAAGAGLGSMLPGKLKGVGTALGVAAGTGLGVHGGEAIGKKLDQHFPKTAGLARAGQLLSGSKKKLLEGAAVEADRLSRLAPDSVEAAQKYVSATRAAESEGLRVGASRLAAGLGAVGAAGAGAHHVLKDKTAEKEEKPTHPAITMGKSVLGLTAGVGAGYAGMMGVNKLLERRGGTGITNRGVMMGVPVFAGALGMAAPYLHQMTLEKMRAAHLKKQEAKGDGS